jgi:hypothetical protein
MRKPPNNGVGYIIDLAEIALPGGVIRVDRCRMAFEHELTLGHYGLPHAGGVKPAVRRYQDGQRKAITAKIVGRSVAAIMYQGWDELLSKKHTGRNAETAESTVLYVERKRMAQNPAMELMIAAFLHRTDGKEWTAEELSPIEKIEVMDITPTYSALGARITLRGGRVYEVDFKDIDGYRAC